MNRKVGYSGIRLVRICTEQMAPLMERLSTSVMVREEMDPVELIHTQQGSRFLISDRIPTYEWNKSIRQ